MLRPYTLATAACLLASTAASLAAQQRAAAAAELQFTVILTRHGVRSPTWTTERLNEFSSEAWPDWGVPPGHLTPHGRTLMKIFGAYYRQYFAGRGLFRAGGCEDAGRLFIWADTDQRTLETGRALSEGVFPGCKVPVHALAEGEPDPLFSPVALGIGKPDRKLAGAAVSGRVGGRPEALLHAYRPALETLQYVLTGCKSGAKCAPVKQWLLDLPAGIDLPGKGDRLTEMTGPLATASTLSQVFLLEYCNGMAGKQLGWGRLDESTVRQMLTLHTAYADLLRRTTYIARIQGSNLLSHMLNAMEQAVARKAVPGALGKPGDRAVIVVGHDTNLSNLSGMLGISWLLEGYQRDDTPPGGALVFELWREATAGRYSVRTYYTAQTLAQMRNALPLSLDAPPPRAPVFLPGCGTAAEGFPCEWGEFRRIMQTAIDPAFVKP